MSLQALWRPDLAAFQPYRSARMEASSGALFLNANESAYPAPGDPLALHRYPDPQPRALLEALAACYRCAPEQLLIGRGSDEAIDLLLPAAVQGARVIEVPLRVQDGFALDVEAVIAAWRPGVKLVFVCRPNNPTGGLCTRAEVLELVAALAGRALVVVDEAYIEYAEAESLIDDLPRFEHLAVLRTLSKAYGLAGARVGVLAGHPELIAGLRRIMAPYPLPTPSVAAALAVLADHGRIRRQIRAVIEARERLRVALECHPAVRQVLPSRANFLTFRLGDAVATYAGLCAQGVVVRQVGHYLGLADALRVTVGTVDENERFLAALDVATRCAA
jgi:histidinol-phosphate aminotransferase